MQKARLDEVQAGIKIARININNLIYADDTSLMAEKEELKSLLIKVKEETQHSEHNVHGTQPHYFMANRWVNSGKSDNFIFLGSKITADGDCSQEIKKHLLLGRKAMTNLYSILRSRYITLLTKFHLVKAMVFPVVMYGFDSWTTKKAEHQGIDALICGVGKSS